MKPEMRFEDYKDDWNNIPINKLLTFNNGINAPKESYGHGRKFINVLDILNNNYVVYEKIIDSVSVDAKQEETSKVEYGDMLFLRSSETREDVGKSTTYLDENEYALFGGFVIRGKKIGNYNPYFLKLLLDTSSARNQISSKAGGSTRYNVSQSILNTVELFMPDNQEQEKIASFFMLLDQKIVKQQEKIEKLEELKKGMMQKIFSQETRFIDGHRLSEWKMEPFNNLFKSVSTRPYQIKSSEIQSEGKYEVVDQGRFNIAGYSNEEQKLYYDCPAIIYGDHTTNVKYRATPFVIGADGTKVLIGKSNNILLYLFYALSFYNVNSEGYKRHFSILKDLILPLPDKKEQQKIADFISGLDAKIALETKKVETLNEQKNGLMQQMFI